MENDGPVDASSARFCNSHVVARYLIDTSKKGLLGARSETLEGIDEDKVSIIMAEIVGTS